MDVMARDNNLPKIRKWLRKLGYEKLNNENNLTLQYLKEIIKMLLVFYTFKIVSKIYIL